MGFPRLLALLVLLQGDWALARIGVEFQMALGNPSDAKHDPLSRTNYLIQRPEYALSYNNDRRQPNWVSWSVSAGDRGSSTRSDHFQEDKSLPDGFTRLDGAAFGGKLDRGHMCPSADRTCSPQNNMVTFLMSNIVPQAAGNNRGPWSDFEQYCRTLATDGREVLLVSGPSDFRERRTASGVPVPEKLWKIAVVHQEQEPITRSTRVLALSMPNQNEVQGTRWSRYLTSVGKLESETGYRFFGTLSASTAAHLKMVVDPEAGDGESVVQSEASFTKDLVEEGDSPHPAAASKPDPAPIRPVPVVLPESPSLVVYRVARGGAIECKVAKARKLGEVEEITGEDGKILLLGAHLVMAVVPLPPAEDIPLTEPQIDLALRQYDRAETSAELQAFLSQGRMKWVARKASLKAP